jgi:NitT/TauT family transport system substrate-binding protein
MQRESIGMSNLAGRIAASLAVLAAVAAAGTPPAAAQAPQKVTVTLALEPAGTTAALFLAEVKGWNREAGIEADIRDGRGSMASIQLVAAGQMDIGTGGLGAMAIAKSKGAPLMSIAGLSRRTDLGVLVDANGPIRTVADLKGKKLLLFAASPWVPYLDTFQERRHQPQRPHHHVPRCRCLTPLMPRAVDGVMSIGPTSCRSSYRRPSR